MIVVRSQGAPLSRTDLKVTYPLYNFSTEMTSKHDINVEETLLKGREKLEKVDS